MKRCSKCQEEKGLEEFSRSGKLADGSPKIRSVCKACDSSRRAVWLAENRDRKREADTVYRRSHLGERRKQSAQWRERNPDYLANWREQNPDYFANWREQNPDYFANWREQNPDYFAKYRAENLELCRKRTRVWVANNPDKVRANSARRRARKANAADDGTTREDLIADAIERDDYGCWWCDQAFSAEIGPVVEHIEPLAWEDAGRGHVWDNLALSCAACNGSKLAKDPMEWYRADIGSNPAHIPARDTQPGQQPDPY